MILRCPDHPHHDTFTVKAKVLQEWEVDEKGDFLAERRAAIDVIAGPFLEDAVCTHCGAQAQIQD